jgi:hypothetical protein
MMLNARTAVGAVAAVAVVVAVIVAIVLATRGDGSDEGQDDLGDVVPTDALETAVASGQELADWEIAENDMNPDLPGTFVPSQGRQHFNYTYDPDRTPRPFCDGVATAESDGTPSVETEATNCYASNPPSSGQHLPSQRNADLGNGASINIPPDPDVYPSDVEIPREAIPHILEHAGVFVGYHCDDGDAACEGVVEQVERIVNDRIDSHNDRVVMARDSDLPLGSIGMSSWTRVDTFAYGGFTEDRVEQFIATHSCRFDPEGFCG